jgi:hypothetical protein
MQRWIIVVLSLLLFVGSIITVQLFFSKSQQGTIEFELAKALLQLGLVSVAGGVVSMLVFEYQRWRNATDKSADQRRKEMEYRKSRLSSILTRAMAAYRQTKKARRILRARAISGEKGAEVILERQYDECLDMLNDAQLDFEDLARDVGTSGEDFSNAEALKDKLHSMEDYLGDLITEFEKSRRSFSGDEASLPLSKLPLLADFVLHMRKSQFRAKIVEPFHEVEKHIRADLRLNFGSQ